jgi:hypothetical protein
LKGYGIIAMERTDGFDEHERIKELCALRCANSLSFRERLELEQHLEICCACRDIEEQYSAIGAEGMAFLAQGQPLAEEARRWDDSAVRERLLSSIRGQRSSKVLSILDGQPSRKWILASLIARRELVAAGLAAVLMVAVAVGAYRIGERMHMDAPASQRGVLPVRQTVAAERQGSESLLVAEAAEISKLELQISERSQELARLKMQAGLADARVSDLESLNGEAEDKLHRLKEERDRLASQLESSENAYQKLQTDFNSLKADYNRSLLHVASLESDVTSLTALNRDQERRMKDNEQYLVSDRDIRELMGARKLYIADVFDVDSASRTRKPFGRVFYTQNKSLVFYAFDLDHQPGAKNASDFQVWGQRDSESNGAPRPMNLGILYMDSESNRRWVLRTDDPQQLAEIDAVFVTVEPHGGSQKPTGKPLLYALLRKEANHP